jgi:chemotaxis protein methyltransferase CheR
LSSYTEYYHLINTPEHNTELARALELITTNETYFFREENHFEFLRKTVLPPLQKQDVVRIWSGACSSGEELYSIAMMMTDQRSGKWELMGSDINQTMLDKAAKGIYPDQRMELLPAAYRKRFCRQGVGPYAGFLRIAPELRCRIRLQRIELHNPLPDIGLFDIVFLRNVMIYFNSDVRKKVVQQIVEHINPGGYLFVGHSESLRGVHSALHQVLPAIYQVRS